MIKRRENILFNNSVSNNYIKQSLTKKNSKLTSGYINDIIKNIDKKKDALHSLSNKFKFDFNNKKIKKYKIYKTIVIVGMGGSILGTKAIYSFLEHRIKKKFYFFDNLDEYNIKNLQKREKPKKILFFIISKSGNTVETLTNINLLNKMKLSHSNTIIITEKKNNALIKFSKNNNITVIEHKNYIGGRYSVLTEVGMLPAFFMGLKIKNIRRNSLSYLKKDKRNILIENVSKITQIYSLKKFATIIFFNYCSQLNNFILWFQQLIAESLGKKGKGLLPVLSLAPKDHHSLLQLYLEGPKDKIFYIVSSESFNNLKINKNLFGNNFQFLKNKKVNNILKAQKDAFIAVLKKKNIPFREIKIKKISEETIGELFSYFILETVLIGKLMGVNPYNQPAVEEVKALTKKKLV